MPLPAMPGSGGPSFQGGSATGGNQAHGYGDWQGSSINFGSDNTQSIWAGVAILGIVAVGVLVWKRLG